MVQRHFSAVGPKREAQLMNNLCNEAITRVNLLHVDARVWLHVAEEVHEVCMCIGEAWDVVYATLLDSAWLKAQRDPLMAALTTLLPAYKKWQQNAYSGELVVNLAKSFDWVRHLAPIFRVGTSSRSRVLADHIGEGDVQDR